MRGVGVTSRACTKRFTASSAQSSRKVAGLGPLSVEASWQQRFMRRHETFMIANDVMTWAFLHCTSGKNCQLSLPSFAESLLNSTLICPPWLDLWCPCLSQMSAKLSRCQPHTINIWWHCWCWSSWCSWIMLNCVAKQTWDNQILSVI